MKNSIKLGALALALTVSFAACSGSKPAASADSTAVKADTTVKADTAKADTTKKDTTKKM
jgi:ABC-type glycerol-3-phosphate transport system substrate-binding protein